MTDIGSQRSEVGTLTLPEFGSIELERVLAQDELFAVVKDKHPVAEGHTLIIPKRPVVVFLDLTLVERTRLMAWAAWVERHWTTVLSHAPDGFNLGVNDGPAAGQTMPQFHFHVIPRWRDDVADPRGGVRWVKPDKAKYWA